MKIFVDISNTKLSYEYFEDVMNFHINGAKHCTICFMELNSFILKYAYSHKFEIEKVEKIPLGALALIFGKNINILNECKALKIKYRYLGDYNGEYCFE